MGAARPALLSAVLSAVLAATAGAEAARRGPVTGLPLPRFVSLNAAEANIRRGPGLTHRIDWVFMRRGAPLQVTAEFGAWRKVRDHEGAEGWAHHALLSGRRTAVVAAAPEALLRADPGDAAALAARAEAGAVAELEACRPDWCRLDFGEAEGWARKADLWGVGPDEVFD
jgi:SH3-like domain-containing protein